MGLLIRSLPDGRLALRTRAAFAVAASAAPLFPDRGQTESGKRGAQAERDSAAVRLRHDRGVRQLRRHLWLGKRPSRVLAAVPALRLGSSLGALAQYRDEPDRSGPVRRVLHGLGPRLLARSSRHDRHRRQDRAPQPRPGQGTGRAASGLRLRRQRPSGSRAGGRRRQDQRNDGDPSVARETRRRPQPRRRRGHHRRRRLQSSDRPIHPRRRSRLSARRQRQSADLAGRYRGRLRGRRQGPGRNRRRSRQGPRPHRDSHRLGVAAGRLARRRPALSRRSPLHRCARDRQGRSEDRTEGSLPVRRSCSCWTSLLRSRLGQQMGVQRSRVQIMNCGGRCGAIAAADLPTPADDHLLRRGLVGSREKLEAGHGGTGTANHWHLQFAEGWVVQYNFYVNDARWGRMFVRMCPYLPFSARICLNQHHWLANRLREESVDFRQCSNAFIGCAEPRRLQEFADELTPRDLVSCGQKWLACFTPFFTPQERDEAGCRHRLFFAQTEFCDNLVFHRRVALDKLGERLLDANRTIGQPDKLTTIFGHKVTKSYRGKLQTEIENMHLPNPVIRSHYRNGFIKQYVRDHLILRTEASTNNVTDYGVGKAVDNLPALRTTLSAINNNYLNVQQDIVETFIDRGQLRKLAQPTVTATGKRIPGLKLDNPRQLALMHALVRFTHIAAANSFATAELYPRVLAALGSGAERYTLASRATISRNCAPRVSSKSCRTRAATGSSPTAIRSV